MRAFLAGTLVFVAACASLVGLDEPGEAPLLDGADGSTDGPTPSPDAPEPPDSNTPIDAGGDTSDGAMPRPMLCDENGLVGRWKLDEGSGGIAHDCTSNRHDGTITGAQWAAGKVGPGSLRFTNDVVDVGNPTAFQITGPITVAAWINPMSGTTASGRIVSKSSQTNRGWEINLEGGTSLEFKIATGTTSYTEISTPITTGTWHHVAGVYAPGSDYLRLYLDGVQANSLTGVASAQRDSPFNVLIGAHPNETCCKFPGDIDDVRIYARALGAAEITTVMNAAQ